MNIYESVGMLVILGFIVFSETKDWRDSKRTERIERCIRKSSPR